MNFSEELPCVQLDRPSVLWCLYKFAYVCAWSHRKWWCVMSPSSSDQEILRKLEKEKILVFTPSRRVQGRRVVCYDDRFIVKLACDSDGIIVSNDNYRDLQNEKPEWKKFIEERLLMYSFVNDKYARTQLPWWRGFLSLSFICVFCFPPSHSYGVPLSLCFSSFTFYCLVTCIKFLLFYFVNKL